MLTVDLYWQSEGRPTGNYGVFVHVGPPGKPPLAQASGGPANWARPVASWRPGEIILDSHRIQLPAGLETEGLPIMAGMYDPAQPVLRLPWTIAGEIIPDGGLTLGSVPHR